jgi:hypothetical protein
MRWTRCPQSDRRRACVHARTHVLAVSIRRLAKISISQDLFRFAGTSFATDPVVTFTGVRDATFDPMLTFPIAANGNGAYFGPTSNSTAPLSLNPRRSSCSAPASSRS